MHIYLMFSVKNVKIVDKWAILLITPHLLTPPLSLVKKARGCVKIKILAQPLLVCINYHVC